MNVFCCVVHCLNYFGAMEAFSLVKYDHAIHGNLPRRIRRLVKLGYCFENPDYIVLKRYLVPSDQKSPAVVHLSIKRKDDLRVRSWVDLQMIKNSLVGPECEGVEIFPAESRKVDYANQYHLWILLDPDKRFLQVPEA